MKNIYLEKAKRTIESHSWGYANTWGIAPKNLAYYRSTGKPYTGIFGKDYNCTVEALAKSFECENCPICGRSYAFIAEGRKGVAGNPLWHKTFHIWFPDWTVVCRSCHSKIEGKPREEWEAYKRHTDVDGSQRGSYLDPALEKPVASTSRCRTNVH
jgi:hypothetical protein